jgi:hypothetical protein
VKKKELTVTGESFKDKAPCGELLRFRPGAQEKTLTDNGEGF